MQIISPDIDAIVKKKSKIKQNMDAGLAVYVKDEGVSFFKYAKA